MPKFYLPRSLLLGDETVSEAKLIRHSSLIVVLAEPGAGKTELLEHLAHLLETQNVRASRFRNLAFDSPQTALVIDAMDEVAKVDGSALNDIIEKAWTLSSGSVVFASRSGEWEEARTKYVKDCFGRDPTIIRLKSFQPHEQKLLFEHEFPNEDFHAFQEEVARCDLTPLLGNPEFLKLLGGAYLENNKRFSNKTQIYLDAAKRLAKESNDGRSIRGRPDAERIVNHAGRIFARLLLSGATGVSRVEAANDREFPYAGLLDRETNGEIDHLLDSKLFKPASDANEHEPVHRIVAEYLAARYLAKRISDPGDSLSIGRCLAIVAPNGVVRDELRGMLGWLAALGNDSLQENAIKIDPYAILANGDPAQLQTTNKILLLQQLQELEKTDPYFRRSDSWRTFNVGQFFSEDVIEGLRPILSSRNQAHLRGLVLELLPNTPAIPRLSGDLEAFVMDTSAESDERITAFRLLLGLGSYDLTAIASALLQEASPASLRMLTEVLKERGRTALTFDDTLSLLRALAGLYPNDKSSRLKFSMSRYFIKEFLQTFSPDDLPEYLDALTENIRCTCNPKHDFMCDCRYGISKIVGGLLDRYFQVESGPYDPQRIWRWIKDLRFLNYGNSKDSASVHALQTDDALRRMIQRIAFDGTNTAEQCHDVMQRFFYSRSHAGLFFKQDDALAIVNFAFESGNVGLWEAMWRRHTPESGVKQRDELRFLMRSQSRENPEMFRVWYKNSHAAKQWLRENRKYFAARSKRYERREQAAKEKMFEHLRDNRSHIEAGKHWWWLQNFAQYYLLRPDEFDEITDDITTVHKALRNCFPFLAPHVPTIETLAQGRTNVVVVLHAACVLHFREQGTLEHIAPDILKAVKTDTGGYPGLPEEERKAFEDEIDRLLFPTPAHIEQFAREYIEPQLSGEPNAVTSVYWLRDKQPFQILQKTLPMEWLRRFPNMPINAEGDLFKMAAQHVPLDEIRALVAERCEMLYENPPENSSPPVIQRRKFWLLNSFFYDDRPEIWNLLKADKNSLLDIAARVDRFGDDSSDGLLPLSATKIYNILDAFVSEWPKVHLPNSYGTGDPPEEQAYRFLREIVWRILKDRPENAIPVLDTLLDDPRFEDFRNDLLAIRATSTRKLALQDFRAPSPAEIVGFLEQKTIASVEDLRALTLEALAEVGRQIQHADTSPLEVFYDEKGQRVDENTARNRIVEHLKGHMTANRLSVAIEHHMSGGNRCDFTAAATIEGARRLLTVEVKGQWHTELFSAAATQLNERYASHPDASQQGIYLVLWFGPDEKVAGKKNHGYATPATLREAIIQKMLTELRGRIDVHLIDLSKSQPQSQEEAA